MKTYVDLKKKNFDEIVVSQEFVTKSNTEHVLHSSFTDPTGQLAPTENFFKKSVNIVFMHPLDLSIVPNIKNP